MKKFDKKLTVTIFVCVLILAAVIYFVFFHKRKLSIDNTAFPIKFGDEGENVRKLQKLLNTYVMVNLYNDAVYNSIPKETNGNPVVLVEDGIFGSKTRQMAVAIFGHDEVTRSDYEQKLVELVNDVKL